MGASEWTYAQDGGWRHRSGWRVKRAATRRAWFAFAPNGGRALGEHRTRVDAMAWVSAVWESYAVGSAIREAAMAGYVLAAVTVEHVDGWPVVAWRCTDLAGLGEVAERVRASVDERRKEKPGSRPGQ